MSVYILLRLNMRKWWAVGNRCKSEWIPALSNTREMLQWLGWLGEANGKWQVDRLTRCKVRTCTNIFFTFTLFPSLSSLFLLSTLCYSRHEPSERFPSSLLFPFASVPLHLIPSISLQQRISSLLSPLTPPGHLSNLFSSLDKDTHKMIIKTNTTTPATRPHDQNFPLLLVLLLIFTSWPLVYLSSFFTFATRQLPDEKWEWDRNRR